MTRPHLAWWASGALYLVALLVLGLLLGLAVATRILPTSSDMGWDQLADALAGALVGAVSGFVLAIFTLRHFGPAQRCKLAGVAILGAVLALAFMRLMSPLPNARADYLPDHQTTLDLSVSVACPGSCMSTPGPAH